MPLSGIQGFYGFPTEAFGNDGLCSQQGSTTRVRTFVSVGFPTDVSVWHGLRMGVPQRKLKNSRQINCCNAAQNAERETTNSAWKEIMPRGPTQEIVIPQGV